MSQNFSKMSDIYVPELIELDSYWQKAVEDAICDTLKGEKRLYYALKNRKKINAKLEKLGLKPAYSQMSFSGGRYQFRSQSFEDKDDLNNYEECKSASYTDWDSYDENSTTSLGTGQNEDVCSRGVPSYSHVGSKSRSKDRKETPPEKIYKNPERPIVGSGSLEKMKKSQNSFYCEPMGAEDDVPIEENEMDWEKPKDFTNMSEPEENDNNKKVKCLHFREDGAFEDSDSEKMQKYEIQNHTIFRNIAKKKIPMNQLPVLDEFNKKFKKIPTSFGPKEDLFWETEVKNAIRENAGQERKLYFALAKRDIVSENLGEATKKGDKSEIIISESEAKLADKKRKSKKFLSPFVKFYLEVYKELCHKCSIRQIAAEATARWWQKSKQKSKSRSATRRLKKNM